MIIRGDRAARGSHDGFCNGKPQPSTLDQVDDGIHLAGKSFKIERPRVVQHQLAVFLNAQIARPILYLMVLKLFHPYTAYPMRRTM